MAGSCGSGMRSRVAGSLNAGQAANSLRRPSVTACASSGPKSREEQERRRGRPLLAHEQQRDRRREQQHRARPRAPPSGGASAEMRSPKARLPIWSWFCRKSTNAVGGSAALGSPRARAAAVRRGLALVGEALGQRARQQPGRLARVVAVVAVALAGQPARGRRGARRRSTARRSGRASAPRWRRSRAPGGRGAPARPRRARARPARRGTAAASRRWISCTASRRKPSKRYSRSQYSAFCTKNSRTVAGLLAVDVDRRAPRRVVALGEERAGVQRAGSCPRGRSGCRRRRGTRTARARAPRRRTP